MDHFGNYSEFLATKVSSCFLFPAAFYCLQILLAFGSEAGPNQWNDPDMIMAGNDHYGRLLSPGEARVQMAVWCVLAAPLIMSNDLRTVTAEYRDVLLNAEAIAVDQDPLGKVGITNSTWKTLGFKF